MTEWLTIEVTLSGTPSEALDPAPGRLMLCHLDNTFSELAEAINLSFARWDLSPDHEFVMTDQRVLSSIATPRSDDDVEDSDEVTLGEILWGPGTSFSYVFDLGRRWTHQCRVVDADADIDETSPDGVVPVLGWGQVPDQYGQHSRPEELAAPGDVAAGDPYDDLDPADAWRTVRVAIGTDGLAGDPPLGLAAAAATLQARWAPPAITLVRLAAELEEPYPDDEEALWTEAAAGIVDPAEAALVRAEDGDGWEAVETADWTGAVIELVRRGPGTAADADALLELIAHCPEVEESDLDAEDEALLRRGLTQATELLAAIGAIDEESCLTPLGAWGLPRALRRAWID